MKAVILKGERVVLRPLRMSDAAALLPHVNDKELMRYHMSAPGPFSLKDEKEYVKRTMKGWKKGENLEWAITFDGRLTGVMTLHHIDKKHLTAEIGLWVASEHHRKGIGYESCRLVLNFAFKKLKMNRINYYLYTPNVASRQLIRKLGGVFEGKQRDVARKDGVFLSGYTYSILRREWKK